MSDSRHHSQQLALSEAKAAMSAAFQHLCRRRSFVAGSLQLLHQYVMATTP